MNSFQINVVFFACIMTVSCTSIPEKVPELIEVSSHTIDNQSALAVAEWEGAIAAANASKKMLELINSFLSTFDRSALSSAEQKSISNFSRGYPIVIKQLEAVMAQKTAPQDYASKTKIITDAIRLANTYIARTVDENGRIEAVINSIQTLKK